MTAIGDELGFSDLTDVQLARNESINENLPLRGHLLIELFGPDGVLKDSREINNLVVTAGKNHIASTLSSSPPTAMSHMAVGTGSTAPAAGDTALGAEIATTGRQALTSRTASLNVVTYVGNWAAGQATNAAIAEAGIFNASSGGTMLARATFTAINKGASDTLQITWTVTAG